MKRVFLATLLLTFFTFLLVKNTFAQEQFAVDVDVTYEVQDSGTTHVTHNISLTNLESDLYAKSYSLTLENLNPQNIKAKEGSTPLSVFREQQGNQITLKIQFDESVLGKNESRKFSVSFDESSFVTRTGEVWEIAIPRLDDTHNFRSYNATLKVPKVLGQEAYLSPDPIEKSTKRDFYEYYFDKNLVASAGISAGYGEFQVFSFNLKYHLENPLGSKALTTIALPPDTYFQKVFYQEIKPAPKSIIRDVDGNWIAEYELSGKQKLEVFARGAVQLFSEPRSDLPKVSSGALQENLKPTKYWESANADIVKVASRFKTARDVYDYVVGTLSYDYARVSKNVERYGAAYALNNPSNSICMEFTDLFIALARASGIPAREINGYAYTENPAIEPLSLVADVLHSWPEYWDASRNIWIPVDPTWGNTTGGVNFFDKLDLRHFAFVIHGVDAESPYPAGAYKSENPQKDVFVNFGKLPTDRQSKTEIVAAIQNQVPFLPPTVYATVQNTGEVAIYNLEPKVYFDDDLAKSERIDVLLPYSEHVMVAKVPYGLLAIDTPDVVSVFAGKAYLSVPIDRVRVIVYNLVALVVIITIAVLLIFVRSGRIRIHGISLRKNKSHEG